MTAPPRAGQQAAALRDAIAAVRKEVAGLIRLAILLGVIGALLSFATVYGRIMVYSLALPASSNTTLIALGGVLCLCAALFTCVHHLRDWALIAIGNGVSRRLAIPALLAAAEVRGRPEDTARQALHDLEEVKRWVAGPTVAVILDGGLVLLYVALLLLIHWSLAVAALVGSGMAALISLWSHHSLYPRLPQVNALRAGAMQVVSDAIAQAEAVEAMGMRAALLRRGAGLERASSAELSAARRLMRRAELATDFLNSFMRGAGLVLVVLLPLSGVDLGLSLVGALLMISLVMAPFARAGSIMESWAAGRAALARLQQLAAQLPARPGRTAAFTCPEGLLTVEQLTVLLPGMARPVLRDISLVVSPGDVVGIAGPVGSGKSTLLRAVIGILRPTAGGCYLDGHMTWQWDRTDMARHVGFLPQELGLDDCTVAEAIARLDEPNMVLVIEAARRAGAHNFIVDLPMGYSTPLSAYSLSAGQRQRIGLARAIYGRPRIVVLDEPGSWLDRKGEEDLLRLFASLKADGTSVLFTSHNLDLVNAADQVVRIQGGTRAGAGTRVQPLLTGRRVGSSA